MSMPGSEQTRMSEWSHTHSWALCGSLRERSAFTLVGRLALGHRIFTQRPNVEVCVFPPADAAVVAEDVRGEALWRLPPCLGLSCATCTTVVVVLRELDDNGAFVIRSICCSRLLGNSPARSASSLDPLVLLAQLGTSPDVSTSDMIVMRECLLLPVTIETDDLRHSTSMQLFMYQPEFCAELGNAILKGSDLGVSPALVSITGLMLLPLQGE